MLNVKFKRNFNFNYIFIFSCSRLKDVQADLKRLLPPDAILVGQSLNCDLKALEMMHPYVIDTSIIFNITGNRYIFSRFLIIFFFFDPILNLWFSFNLSLNFVFYFDPILNLCFSLNLTLNFVFLLRSNP